MADALDAWLETRSPTWAASTVRDQTSRVSLVKADRIARDAARAADRGRRRPLARPAPRAGRRRVVAAQPAPGAAGRAVAGGAVGMGVDERGRAGHPRPADGRSSLGDVGGGGAGRDRGRRPADPAAGVAFRLAAITGARRAELCALVCTDLDGDRLTIDSSIAIERSGSIAHRQVPALIDAATKTGNRRVVRLDPQTVAAIEALWSLSEWWGPWLLHAVRATAEPGAADELVAPGPPGRRPRPTVAAPRPAPLVGHRGHRPRPRHPDGGRPIGTRQPGHDPADVRARAGRRRRRRGGDAGERPWTGDTDDLTKNRSRPFCGSSPSTTRRSWWCAAVRSRRRSSSSTHTGRHASSPSVAHRCTRSAST